MIVHFFNPKFKYYEGTMDIPNINEENAKKGLEIPCSSTIIKPPLEECQNGEIPIFKDSKWIIVKDDFWYPIIKEINYDAGRKMETFEYKNYSSISFMSISSLYGLCSGLSVATKIEQATKIINKKFRYCIELHKNILENNGYSGIDMSGEDFGVSCEKLAFSPSIIYEFKLELEAIVYIMRRILDSLVQLVDVLVYKDKFDKTKTITFDSIGSILSSKNKQHSIVIDIILGSDVYKKDDTNFLNISNNLFNGYKHTLMHDETNILIGAEVPTFVSYYLKYKNYNKVIEYHNHNAYHIMMGFQDTIDRIIYNINLYKNKEL